METMSYTALRRNFSCAMSKVCNDHLPIIVTHKNVTPVVMMSLDDYNAILETGYLLGTPNNITALLKSMQEANN